MAGSSLSFVIWPFSIGDFTGNIRRSSRAMATDMLLNATIAIPALIIDFILIAPLLGFGKGSRPWRGSRQPCAAAPDRAADLPPGIRIAPRLFPRILAHLARSGRPRARPGAGAA